MWTVLYRAATIVWSAWAIVIRKRTVKITLLSGRYRRFLGGPHTALVKLEFCWSDGKDRYSMDEGTKGRMSELLIEASRLLSSSTYSNAASNSTRPPAIPQAAINETLRRAQGILSESSSTDLCRRLNQQEWLRAAAGTSYLRTSQANKHLFRGTLIQRFFAYFWT